MSWGVFWSRDDYYIVVVEHIIVSIEQHALAVLESAESGCRATWILRRCIREHRHALRFLHKPSRSRKAVGIGRMIVMIVRQGEICDVGRLIADFSQLAAQCFVNSGSGFGGPSGLNQIIRDDAGVPQ